MTKRPAAAPTTTLTDRGMQSAAPVTGDRWLRKSLGRGHGVLEGRITSAGERLFYFRYTTGDGTRQRHRIGVYSRQEQEGTFTLSGALNEAQRLSALLLGGVRNLSEHFEAQRVEKERAEQRAKQEAERQITVSKLFDQWKAGELRPHVGTDGKRLGRKDGGAYVEALFKAHGVFKAIGDRPANAVQKSHVMNILDGARNAGKMRTANVLLATLRQMFRYALARELIDRNPADTITRRDAGGKETERTRVLSADEIKALVRKLPDAAMSPRTVAAVWLTLATAVRIGECAGARWEHIDFKARTWHLPETKNQREHTVHLSKFALRQLDALHALRPLTPTGAPSPYVFPSAADTANGIDPRTFGKQLTDRQRPTDGGKWAGRVASAALALPGGRWTPHDLRRTAATLMAELGVSSDVIDECLNHKIESKVRRIYIRDRRLADQARAFDALGKRLESLIAESVVSNVAPSRKRSRVVAK